MNDVEIILRWEETRKANEWWKSLSETEKQAYLLASGLQNYPLSQQLIIDLYNNRP